MTFLFFIPVLLSYMLIAAHFQRAGLTIVALLCLAVPLLLFVVRPWSVRVTQLLLSLAAIEWVRTLVGLVQLRLAHDMAWGRLALIIGVVIVFTAGSIFILELPRIKNKYNF